MRPLVLFVGARADARARIAASILTDLAGERYSAVATGEGDDDSGELAPEVVEAIAAEDVDVTRAARATLTRRLARSADRVVFVGPPGEDPPPLPVSFERWGVPAPEGRHPDEVKVIVDTLRRLVQRLVARLDTEALVT